MDITKLYDAIKNSGVDLHIDTLYKARQRGEMTKKLALICEQATGIPAPHWVFPERFKNPWECRIRKNKRS